jgi:segregation and condensation protein A
MNKLAANELSLSIENFDGPIDLLAQLVSKQKIDILKVNVLEIVDQYVDYIKNNIQNLDIDSASEYLNMAAYLVEFKSRKLLPELSTEEDKNFEYERDKLLQRIIEHNKYKEIVPKLVNSHTKRHKMSGKAPSDLTKYKEMQKKDTTFTLPKSINPDRLSKA